MTVNASSVYIAGYYLEHITGDPFVVCECRGIGDIGDAVEWAVDSNGRQCRVDNCVTKSKARLIVQHYDTAARSAAAYHAVHTVRFVYATRLYRQMAQGLTAPAFDGNSTVEQRRAMYACACCGRSLIWRNCWRWNSDRENRLLCPFCVVKYHPVPNPELDPWKSPTA